MVGLLWGAVELARVVSTYYLVVGLLPLPAMLLMLGYFTALLWHDGASPNAMKHQ